MENGPVHSKCCGDFTESWCIIDGRPTHEIEKLRS